MSIQKWAKRIHWLIIAMSWIANIITIDWVWIFFEDVTFLVVLAELLPDTINEGMVHEKDRVTGSTSCKSHVTTYKGMGSCMVILKFTVIVAGNISETPFVKHILNVKVVHQ